MARRLIGLDIGTHAVRVAVVEATDTPTLHGFGQVALPEDAMRDGEVVDSGAVTAAIDRLFKELGLKREEVRLGFATPRMIVRQVELPAMSEPDMDGALRFQAQDLIPMPLEDAIFDFQVLETINDADGESINRVLLAAAPRDAVQNIVGAVEGAGLRVGVVDVTPLALIRVLGVESFRDTDSSEAIVSVGEGISTVVIHVAGLPKFVRIISGGGKQITNAIATQVALSDDQSAEALKRQLGLSGNDLVMQARSAAETPTTALIDELRSSIDFYRAQPGALPIKRVLLTGGGSLLYGFSDRLARSTGLPVLFGNPRAGLIIGDLGFDAEALAQLEPFLAVPVGVALGGLATNRRINLHPSGHRKQKTEGGKAPLVAAGIFAGTVLVAILGLSLTAISQKSDADGKLEDAQTNQAELQSELDGLTGTSVNAAGLAAVRTQLQAELQNDVGWVRLLNSIAQTIPTDTWLTGLQASITAPIAPQTTTTAATQNENSDDTTTTAAPVTTIPAGPTGSLSFDASGIGFDSVAAWLDRLQQITSLSDAWVQSAERDATSGIVGFSSQAAINSAARSDRLERLNALGTG